MEIKMNFRYLLLHAGLALFGVLPGIGQAATAVTLPTFNLTQQNPPAGVVPPPGFPSFWNNVTITQTRQASNGDHLLTASASTPSITFYTGANTGYQVTNANYSLTAVFNSAGLWQSGNLLIGGALQSGGPNGFPTTGLGNSPSPTGNFELLYTATLTDYDYDNTGPSSEQALAFKTVTTTPGTGGGWASQFQESPESVYLTGFSVNSFRTNFTLGDAFVRATYNGSAITTVPIPAAAWLFGSAVALMTGVRSKKVNPKA
jgi:hypothetical protein